MKMRKVRDGNAPPRSRNRNINDIKTLPLNGPALAAAYSQLYPSGRSDAELYNLRPFRNTTVNPYSKQFLDPIGMVPTKGGPMRAAAIRNFKQTQARNNPRFEDMGDGYVRVSGGRDVPDIFGNRPLYNMLFRGYGDTETQLVVPNAGPEGEYVRWTSKPLRTKGAPPYARGDVWEFSMPSQPKPGATRGSSAMKRMSSMRKADSERNPEYVNIKRTPAKERLTDKLRARLNIAIDNAKDKIEDYQRNSKKNTIPIDVINSGMSAEDYQKIINLYPSGKIPISHINRMNEYASHKKQEKQIRQQKQKELAMNMYSQIGRDYGKESPEYSRLPKGSMLSSKRPAYVDLPNRSMRNTSTPDYTELPKNTNNKRKSGSTTKRMSSVYKAMATKPISFRNKYM